MTVTTDKPVTAFSLVRYGSTTHTVNNDQRRLALSFRETGPNTYSVDVPSNPGWLLPGKWMLFALDADGTPSVSRTVDVLPNGLVSMVSPGVVVTTVGAAVAVTPNVKTLRDGVTFGGTGLRPASRSTRRRELSAARRPRRGPTRARSPPPTAPSPSQRISRSSSTAPPAAGPASSPTTSRTSTSSERPR